MSNFANLKRSSGAASLSTLTKELEKISNPASAKTEDTRFWKPEVDKAGNGSATIRFLPAPPNEDMPFVRIWDHGFQGPTGKWYIENSRTTLGASEKDPVSEYNSELWNISDDDNSPTRKQARTQKRRLHFISNVLVVKDPSHPENEGKVFLYQYGKKIFDKLNDLMNPQFDDEEAINPFDLWSGANFKLKIRKFEGYRNYDKSEFDKQSAIPGSDEELEALWNKEYSLKTFIDPSNFKTYDELKNKLNQVLGLTGTTVQRGEQRNTQAEASAPKFRERAAEQIKESDDESAPWATESEDDDVSYFSKLKDMINDD